jgi:hypothetical protein
VNRRKLPEDEKYYVYAFVRDSGIPYYIGRGCGYRAWEPGGRAVQPPHDRSRIKIVKEMLSLENANALEILLINFWGRKDKDPTGVLANMQDGGVGGSPGRKMTEKQKEMMKKIHTGKKQSPESIYKRMQWMRDRGATMPEYHREALTEGIRSGHRVWWRHEDLDITFYGTSTELSEKFSEQFYGYRPPGGRRLRTGHTLDRNRLRKVWRGEMPSYKGWTRGTPS